MAAVFPDIMTAFLGRSEITSYFKAVERRRVDVPTWNGRFPLLAAWVINNAQREDAGDAKAMSVANYVLVAAAKMEATKKQDALIGEMVDALELAAKNLVYFKQSGYSAQARLGEWDSDDNVGAKEGARTWIEVPLQLRYFADA